MQELIINTGQGSGKDTEKCANWKMEVNGFPLLGKKIRKCIRSKTEAYDIY